MTPGDRHRPPSSEPPPRARDVATLADRLHALEVTEAVHHAEVTGKLNNGAEAFSNGRAETKALREEVEKLRPRRAGVLAVAGFVFSVVAGVGSAVVSVVSTASGYVDRPTLERAAEKLDDQDDELRDELASLRDRVTRAEAARAAAPEPEPVKPKADPLGRTRRR